MSAGNLGRSEAAHRSEAITVDTYEVRVDVSGARDAERTTFPTTSTVQFASTVTDVWLDFLDGTVASVVVNGAEVPVEYDGARIQLHGLTTEGPNRVTVIGEGTYSRSGQGLHRFVDPVDGETYLYTQYEPADSRRVFANFEQPDLKGRHTFTLVGPAEWELRSNQPEVSRVDEGDGIVAVTFDQTPMLSTYITTLAAGPYHRVTSHWSGHGLDIDLGAMCRKSLVDHFDGEEILKLHREGLDFFHERFGFTYPWGKYEAVFVPEYNLGAMENPGLVTFTEGYVFRSQAVRAQYSGRCNTIQHEMSHMWFGDLVTPRWWDDLWLKESFAEYMGADASAEATEFTDAWVAFGGPRKTWALRQDQLPTTHPIVADIPDLEAAKQNFDGITYAKGAAVLKQLVAYVGEEEFFAGVRDYFEMHAFASATLSDLLRALEKTSGRDLADWSRRWLQTSGPDTLRPVVESADGKVTRLTVEQTSVDALTGETVNRPHRVAVGLYTHQEGQLVRTQQYDVDVCGGAEVPDAVGEDVPDLVLVNDRDLTYAKVRLDETGLATVREHLGACPDPLTRTVLWNALWDMTRDAELPARDYLDVVLTHGPRESHASTLSGAVANASGVLRDMLPPAERDDIRDTFAERVWELLNDADTCSDEQLIWARTFAAVAALARSQAERARALLDGTTEIEGLVLSPELRWSLLKALSAHGLATDDDLADELERDGTNDGITAHVSALAGRPDPQAKAEAWQQLFTPRALPNDHVDSIIAGFTQPLHGELVAPYVDRYFDTLEEAWAAHPIEIGLRLVRGLFPTHVDAIEGQDPEQHPTMYRAQRWLDDHPDAPGALRRIVTEQHDLTLRALRAQLAHA